MIGRFVLVCEHGFVITGVVKENPDDVLRVLVDECQTVRRWGTTKGLGQLAKEGPQSETILDPEGDNVDVLRSTILRAIPCVCDEAAWKQVELD